MMESLVARDKYEALRLKHIEQKKSESAEH